MLANPVALLNEATRDLASARQWGVTLVFGAFIFATYLAYQRPERAGEGA